MVGDTVCVVIVVGAASAHDTVVVGTIERITVYITHDI